MLCQKEKKSKNAMQCKNQKKIPYSKNKKKKKRKNLQIKPNPGKRGPEIANCNRDLHEKTKGNSKSDNLLKIHQSRVNNPRMAGVDKPQIDAQNLMRLRDVFPH